MYSSVGTLNAISQPTVAMGSWLVGQSPTTQIPPEALAPFPSEIRPLITSDILEKLKQIPEFNGQRNYKAVAEWIIQEARNKKVKPWNLPGLKFLTPADFRNMDTNAENKPEAYIRALAIQMGLGPDEISQELQNLIDVGWFDSMQDVKDWLRGGEKTNPPFWLVEYRGGAAQALGLPTPIVAWVRATSNATSLTNTAREALNAAITRSTQTDVTNIISKALNSNIEAKSQKEKQELYSKVDAPLAEATAALSAAASAANAGEKTIKQIQSLTQEAETQTKEIPATIQNYVNAGLGGLVGATAGFLVPFFSGAGNLLSVLIGLGSGAAGAYGGYTLLGSSSSSGAQQQSPAPQPAPQQQQPAPQPAPQQQQPAPQQQQQAPQQQQQAPQPTPEVSNRQGQSQMVAPQDTTGIWRTKPYWR